MPDPAATYRGRFAPSPTGPLHLGSLIAALASYLEARANGGAWLVRMEDLDPPREEPGAAKRILQSLRAHGLNWDEPPLWQGGRGAAYAEALALLECRGVLFHCDCNRKALGPGGICGAQCARRQEQISAPYSIRIQVNADQPIEFHDVLQGPQSDDLARQMRDFILRRKDGLIAYQLAVVVDDAAQGISHIVRGSDLMSSTARQIYLQRQLGLPTPIYCHLPVITNAGGDKFSKQSHAPPLIDAQAPANLRRALAFLAQPPPPAELCDSAAIVSFACGQWSLDRVPRHLAIPASASGQDS